MRRQWRKFQNLTWFERFLLVRILVLLPCIDISLRLIGARRTQSILFLCIPSQPIRDHLTPEMINRCVQLAASRSPYYVTCLRRSLALWWLLTRRGVACSINIGTTNAASGFKAHAWVEWAGGGQSDSVESLKHFTLLGSLGTKPEYRRDQHTAEG